MRGRRPVKKIIFTCFTFGLLAINCLGQNERVEVKLMNCIYENYVDKGAALKKTIHDFEQLLISKNVLKDETGKSYKALFEKILIDNNFKYNLSISFLDKIIEIGLPKNKSFRNCQAAIGERFDYEFSKLKELQIALDSISTSGDITPFIVANGILAVFNENDFELDYYKLTVFLLFGTINHGSDSGIRNNLSEVDDNKKEQHLNNAIKIYIDKNNIVFVNKVEVSLEQLKNEIYAYVYKNKSESVVSLKAERETMYKTYIDVQEVIVGEIRNLREQLAKEKYQIKLENLTTEQLIEIKKVYPERLME